jgi:hypothetical protein
MADAIREWLAAFPTHEAEERLRELEHNRDRISAEIEALQQVLSIATQEFQTAVADTAARLNGNGHPPPSGMLAVERLMAEHEPVTWTRRDLCHALVERGWLAPGEPGRKTLGSILHRMVGRGRIVRVGEGQYRLPDWERQEVMAA